MEDPQNMTEFFFFGHVFCYVIWHRQGETKLQKINLDYIIQQEILLHTGESF